MRNGLSIAIRYHYRWRGCWSLDYVFEVEEVLVDVVVVLFVVLVVVFVVLVVLLVVEVLVEVLVLVVVLVEVIKLHVGAAVQTPFAMHVMLAGVGR